MPRAAAVLLAAPAQLAAAAAQLDEILGYGNVVCLQDVDNYAVVAAAASRAGYDLAQAAHDARQPREDGVLIAWRRAAFQLFTRRPRAERSGRARDRRRARLQSQAIQDNVALMVHLQPWGIGLPVLAVRRALAAPECAGGEIEGCARQRPPTDARRGATVIGGGPGDDGLGACGCCRRACSRALEVFNADFQLPVVCGVALGDIPGTRRRGLVNGARGL